MAYVEQDNTRTGVYIPDDTEINQLFDNLRQLKSDYEDRNYARITINTQTSLTDATWTQINLGTLIVNENDIVSNFDNVTNHNFDLAAGDYRFRVSASFKAGRSGIQCYFALWDGSAYIGRYPMIYAQGGETNEFHTPQGITEFELTFGSTTTLEYHVAVNSNQTYQFGHTYDPIVVRGYNDALEMGAIEIWKV